MGVVRADCKEKKNSKQTYINLAGMEENNCENDADYPTQG